MIALGWTTSQIQRAAASQQRINEFFEYQNRYRFNKDISRTSKELLILTMYDLYPDSGIEALHDFGMHT